MGESSRPTQDWLPRRIHQRLTDEQQEIASRWQQTFENYEPNTAAFLFTRDWESMSADEKQAFFDRMRGLDIDQMEDELGVEPDE